MKLISLINQYHYLSLKDNPSIYNYMPQYLFIVNYSSNLTDVCSLMFAAKDLHG